MKTTNTLLLSLALLGAIAPARAQSALDWFTLDAGGGVQSSAIYTVNFTLGQSDVGTAALTSANYQIVPGFWALEEFGPATGRPALSIGRSGGNILLSWPSPATGFVLQHTDTLNGAPIAWSDTPGVVSDNGFVRSVTVPPNPATRFYRLRQNP